VSWTTLPTSPSVLTVLAGYPLVELYNDGSNDNSKSRVFSRLFGIENCFLTGTDNDEIKPVEPAGTSASRPNRKREFDGPALVKATSAEIVQATSSLFVLGSSQVRTSSHHRVSTQSAAQLSELPRLSSQVTIGRNSRFQNLTPQDREELGGIEYRSLKLLLKIVVGASQ